MRDFLETIGVFLIVSIFSAWVISSVFYTPIMLLLWVHGIIESLVIALLPTVILSWIVVVGAVIIFCVTYIDNLKSDVASAKAKLSAELRRQEEKKGE